jgi:hypothetical protein
MNFISRRLLMPAHSYGDSTGDWARCSAVILRSAISALALALAACVGTALTVQADPAAAPKAAAKTTAATTKAAIGAAKTTPKAAAKAAADSGLTLRGGQEGTAFRSLTVEGEDRIHVEFDRPTLALDLDPEGAPGLDWGSAHDVLDRTVPDLTAPLVALSAHEPSRYVARPWLKQLASGTVATFRPGVEGVDRWKLLIADSRGETVAAFEGKGQPPKAIRWDGRLRNGALMIPGRTYSSVFEAYDRAGNKRHFVGEGFVVSAYRLESPAGPVMVFSAASLFTAGELAAGGQPDAGATALAPPIIREAASWLNQSARQSQPIKVAATARTFEEADGLTKAVTKALGPLVLGGAARVQGTAQVEPDAPQGGIVSIMTAATAAR